MVEFTIVLLKRFFLAFGLVYGQDVFSDVEFEDSACIRIQVWRLSLYFYADTTQRFQKKVLSAAASAAQKMSPPKVTLITKQEGFSIGNTIVGRA